MKAIRGTKIKTTARSFELSPAASLMIISNPSAFPREHDAAESMEAGKDKAESKAKPF